MRLLIVMAVLCIAGCAGTPRVPSPEEKAAAETIKNSGVAPERVRGAYRVVMVKGEKKYCSKELSTGSHVKYRTICLSEEEYAAMEAHAKDTVEAIRSGPVTPGGPPSAFGTP